MLELEYDKIAEFFRVVGDKSRFKVITLLKEGPRNVSEIVRVLGIKQSLASHHLIVLMGFGLVKTTRKGPFVLYALSSEEVIELIQMANEIIQNRNKKGGKNGQQ